MVSNNLCSTSYHIKICKDCSGCLPPSSLAAAFAPILLLFFPTNNTFREPPNFAFPLSLCCLIIHEMRSAVVLIPILQNSTAMHVPQATYTSSEFQPSWSTTKMIRVRAFGVNCVLGCAIVALEFGYVLSLCDLSFYLFLLLYVIHIVWSVPRACGITEVPSSTCLPVLATMPYTAELKKQIELEKKHAVMSE